MVLPGGGHCSSQEQRWWSRPYEEVNIIICDFAWHCLAVIGFVWAVRHKVEVHCCSSSERVYNGRVVVSGQITIASAPFVDQSTLVLLGRLQYLEAAIGALPLLDMLLVLWLNTGWFRGPWRALLENKGPRGSGVVPRVYLHCSEKHQQWSV